MAVPNTNTFSQRDVVTEIYGDSSNRSLTELFSAANGVFDPAYVGSKNSLYNFRNYNHIITTIVRLFELSVIKPSTINFTNVGYNAELNKSIIFGICWSYATSQPTIQYDNVVLYSTTNNPHTRYDLYNESIYTGYIFENNKLYYFRAYVTVNGVTYYSIPNTAHT